ncbi:MAG TPA: hypothetical protein PLC40_14770 [Candidatus Hydrogenedentes bacterium]|nr:hypothetical protein [Candidatus Hydrogenedentota bacterium]
MTKKWTAAVMLVVFVSMVILAAFPAGAQADPEKGPVDFSGMAKCCGITFEQVDGSGEAKCCGCTIASWNVIDMALVAAAMLGLVAVSKWQK